MTIWEAWADDTVAKNNLFKKITKTSAASFTENASIENEYLPFYYDERDVQKEELYGLSYETVPSPFQNTLNGAILSFDKEIVLKMFEASVKQEIDVDSKEEGWLYDTLNKIHKTMISEKIDTRISSFIFPCTMRSLISRDTRFTSGPFCVTFKNIPIRYSWGLEKDIILFSRQEAVSARMDYEIIPGKTSGMINLVKRFEIHRPEEILSIKLVKPGEKPKLIPQTLKLNWIPCETKFPHERERVFVTDEHNFDVWTYRDYFSDCLIDVKYWAEIPFKRLPKAREKEE